MNKIKIGLATAALVVGLGTAGASAMPMNNFSAIDVGAKPEQVHMVCNQWGRCWNRRSYYSYEDDYGYPSYGSVYAGYGYGGYGGYYGGGRRFYGGGRGGWRGGGHHHHW